MEVEMAILNVGNLVMNYFMPKYGLLVQFDDV